MSYLFVNILLSYKYVYQGILSLVIKLTKVKQQVYLFQGKGNVEIRSEKLLGNK